MSADQRRVVLRPYCPSDVDALIALFRDSVRRVAARDYSPEQLRAWAPDAIDRERWARRCAEHRTWVAEMDERPVGFIELEADGHIDMLYVDADHQREGIARALLETVEAAAREAGLARLFAEASLTAGGFFERQGFYVIATQTVHRADQDLANLRMEKALT
ncbi:MAG TPA: GNAT family N-acetyltransferase [Stellaceae bacterium]|nr:GNAT family N-acetyltransferase [Stellaceae bacterium]